MSFCLDWFVKWVYKNSEFGRFVTGHPDVWLNIIGYGSYLSELRSFVEWEGIPNVNFTGCKPLEEMSDYYEASDVLIISLKNVPLYEIMIPSKFQAYLTIRKPMFAIFNGEVLKPSPMMWMTSPKAFPPFLPCRPMKGEACRKRRPPCQAFSIESGVCQ